MEILHRAKEIATQEWVHGFFTGTNEFLVVGDSEPRIAIIDMDTVCVYTGKNCVETGNPIFDKDIVKDYRGSVYHVIYDDFHGAFRLRTSLVYSSSRDMPGSLVMVGNIVDNDFQEPYSTKEPTSRTPSSDSWARKCHKEALRGIGL